MSDSERLNKVGRHGRLSLSFKKREERTILYDSFSTMPMQAFQPFYPDGTGCAYTYLVNPTGGLVGGDRIDTDVTLDEDTHVFITTPSANRVYRSTGEFSSQSVEITLKGGAILEYMPGSVIPFAGSLYRQKTRVCMDKGSTAFILDSFTSGRVAMGESLRFEEYRNIMEIEYCGELLLTERLFLRPESVDYTGLGFLESFTVTAGIYLIFDDSSIEKPLISSLRAAIDDIKGIVGGVSTLPAKGVIVRLLGVSARFIETAIFEIWSIARKHLIASESLLPLKRLNVHLNI